LAGTAIAAASTLEVTRREAEEKAKREAEEAARRGAEAAPRKAEEEKVRLEAEEKAKAEAAAAAATSTITRVQMYASGTGCRQPRFRGRSEMYTPPRISPTAERKVQAHMSVNSTLW